MSSASRISPTSAPPTDEKKSTPEENFEKLHFVYWEAGPAFLRQVFRDLWKCVGKCEWENTRVFGKKLLGSPAGREILQQSNKNQRESVKTGNCCVWDLPLLLLVTKSLHTVATPEELSQLERIISGVNRLNFHNLKSNWNKLSRNWKMSVDELTFKTVWEETSNALASLAMSAELMEKPRNPKPKQNEEIGSASSKKAEEFRCVGNELFKKQRFVKAAAEYSKGIEMEGIPRELLGLLYSNRSVAKMEAKDVEGAKEDAKNCVILRPQWFRGYVRLGKAYQGLKKFDKAALNFNLAIHRGDDSQATVDAFNFCKGKLGCVKEYEEKIDEGVSRDKKFLKSVENAERVTKFRATTSMELCVMGQRYLCGTEGVPVDFRKAGEFYTKAAEMGNAMGIYYLGTMHQEGKGFRVDLGRGHDLYLKAASQEPIKEYVEGSGELARNMGVAEACHGIALSYDMGGVPGIPIDLLKALEWYHKALEYGSAGSAGNIGLVFFHDDIPGFPGGGQLAFEYWKLGAHLKDGSSIDHLAMQYYERREVVLAQMWFHYGIFKGSFALRGHRQTFVRNASLEKNFDPVQFEKQLEEDVRRSSFVGPVLQKVEKFQAKLTSKKFVSSKVGEAQ